ncbi:hypothetical protein [Rugamonas sp. DEMB1]|uniref:hypothetical protein n=1 Tax=Rugamonas sp. DEMB1 TaxID=3039386 RepID=UPI00244C208E|nr:hypothetical protein [Rugamonas sp. DEMB1]WGG50072.1 hypothetical protein QC826_27085 [Rugamonas sp. DEMB1]
MYLEPYQFEPLLLADRQLLDVQAMAEQVISASLRLGALPLLFPQLYPEAGLPDDQ